MPRIFLSHADENQQEAALLVDWSKSNGFDGVATGFLSSEGGRREQVSQRALREEIARCETVLCLVSRAWLGSAQGREELTLARSLHKNIVCALIEDLTPEDGAAPIESCAQKVLLRRGEEEEREFSAPALDALKTMLTQARVDPLSFPWPPEQDAARAPYRGLRPFEADEAGVFFGRDEALIDALDALRGAAEAGTPRFFALVGAAGAGKSSFLQAGLWPRLRRDPRRFAPLAILRPGAGKGLAEALAAAPDGMGAEEIRKALANAETALPLLRKFAEDAAPDETDKPALVLAVDPAEELLSHGTDRAESLLTLLADLAKRDDLALIVIFVTGWDHLAALRRAKPLHGVDLQIFALPPLSRPASQAIIEGPAARIAGRGLEIDPALTQAVLDDMGGLGDDGLPLVGFMLEQLYRATHREGRIALKDYESFGRLAGAIDAAISRVFAIAATEPGFAKGQEARLALLRRGLIPWLASVDPHTGAPRRRQCPAGQIPAEARALVDLLVEQGLARRGAASNGDPILELAHDVLLRRWTLLHEWLLEEGALCATLGGVKRAARDWDHTARARVAAAHRGARLEEAERLYTRPDLLALLDATDRAYVAFCRENEKAAEAAKEGQRQAQLDEERRHGKELAQTARRARRIFWAASLGLVAALSLAGVAGWEWRVAARAQKTAQAQRSRAEKTLLAAMDATNRLIGRLSAAGGGAASLAEVVDTAAKWQGQLPADIENKELRRSRSVALNTLADYRLAAGDAAGAVAAAQQSVAAMERLSTAEPDDAGWRRDLSVAYEKLGDAQFAQGDLAGALQSYKIDKTIAEALSGGAPANGQYLWDLSAAHEKLGDVKLARGDVAGALQSYRADLAIRESLAGANPTNTAWRRDLAVSYERVGEALARQNDAIGARTAFDGALAIYETLAAADPQDVESLLFSVVPHRRLAQLDPGRAREHLRAAVAILERLSSADRLDETRRGWLLAIREELSALGPSGGAASDGRAQSQAQ